MRISSTVFFQTGVNTINTQQSDLMHLYQQIGTGKRMITPSDDPLAAAQTINISQSQSLNARFTENRKVATTALATQENTLTSVTSLLQSIKTRLVEAGNGTLSDSDRSVLGNVLANAKENLLGLANATDGNGQYLFSGHKGSQPAFVADGSGAVSYQGDDGRRQIQVDQTRQLDSADTGREIFLQAAPGTREYVTSSTATNGGTAVIGAPAITDSAGVYIGDSFEITFDDGAGKMQYSIEVFDAAGNAIHTTALQDYEANTSSLALPGGVQVKFSGAPANGDTFRVEPVFLTNSHVAVAGPLPATLDPAVTLGEPAVNDPTGANVGAELFVEFRETAVGSGVFEYQVTVDGTPSGTWLPYTDPGANGSLDLGGGMQVGFSGTPADGDAFTVTPVATPPANLNIFDALDAMIESLNTPTVANPAAAANFSNVLNATMQRVDLTYDQVLTVRSSVGTRLNEIEAIDANSSMRGLSYAQDLSRLEEVDYYEATAQLQLRTAALEAASLAFKKIQATSLFNMNN